MSSNNGNYGIAKNIVEVIRANTDKNVKIKIWLKNKLIVFTDYLMLFFILSHTIKLFYQIYLIYLIT